MEGSVLAKFFIDLCMKEVSTRSRVGNNLGKKSWEKIRLSFKEQKNMDFTQTIEKSMGVSEKEV